MHEMSKTPKMIGQGQESSSSIERCGFKLETIFFLMKSKIIRETRNVKTKIIMVSHGETLKKRAQMAWRWRGLKLKRGDDVLKIKSIDLFYF